MPEDVHVELSVHSGPIIVGVGASAGGLGAFQSLLSKLPADHTLAIVLVQHLDPNHESLLPELLAKHLTTPVKTATDGMIVEGGNIYLIPPGQTLRLADGRLRLEEFEKPRGLRRPIDIFFESLALDAGVRGVGIVLSGTGSDGSNGVRAIKEAGGLVFVQEPKDADYDGMPRSAIETGADDLVLPTYEMIDVINDYFSIRSDLKPSVLSDVEFIARIAKHVSYRTGHDFRHYKQATLLRRLAVRMSVLGLSSPNDYLKELISNKAEASKLFRDLLINVTSFFRDPDAFSALAEKIIPQLLNNRSQSDDVRVWVPGCSTGQEAYTIAMLIAHELERTSATPRVSVFATDIDDEAIKVARKGLYPNSIVDEVPAEFLSAYFVPTASGFEVSSRIREMVRFSNQSIIKDPPFSRVDLVSCRNVTIYFDAELQDFTLSVFHYALKEEGILFLGPSEMPRNLDQLFTNIDSRMRIYKRRPGPSQRLNFPSSSASPTLVKYEPEVALRQLADEPYARTLLSKVAPPFAVADATGSLTYASERAVDYFNIKPGSARMTLTQLIIPELEPALRRLMVRADPETKRREQEYRGRLLGREVRLLISIESLEDGSQLLVFEDRLDLVEGRDVLVEGSVVGPGSYVQSLESELEGARETIRTTVEELETSNEELKSSNEEMMSMNEELQSANEELSTTNEELQGKVAELRKANDDMSNLMSSTKIVTIFLDSDLRLRFFTPESLSVFRFMDSDRGRHLKDIASDVNMDALVQMCQSVLDTGSSIEEEMSTDSGDRRFMLKIEAYSGDTQSATAGVVCTMADITALSRAISEADLERQSSQRRLAEIEQLYHVSPQAMALLKPDATYLRINRQMAEIDGVEVDDHIGKRIQDVLPDLVDQTTRAFETVLETGKAVTGFRLEGTTLAHPNDRRLFMTDWYPVHTEGELVAIGVNVRDVTEQTEMQAELRRMMRELQHRVKNMLSNVLALVSRAGREVTTDAEVLEALAARIKALSGTHKLLTKENWRAADIYDLLEPELTDVYGTDRIKLKGPKLTLNARAAVAFGMAIHELATNAAKYGAFSTDAGSVSFKWVRTDDGEAELVIFRWVERGGPRVEEPRHAGFGSQLVTSTITGSLHGALKMDWHPEGLSVEISIPTDELTKIGEDVIYDIF